MPKLNVGYQSLFETVAVQEKDKTYLPFLSDIFYLVDFTFYRTENDRIYYSENAHVPYGRRYNPYPHRNPYLMQLLGGLQPMDDLAKKVIDIFKPYKAKRDPSFVKEILQFPLGLMRIFKGVITLLMAPLFFGVYTIKYLTSPKTFLLT